MPDSRRFTPTNPLKQSLFKVLKCLGFKCEMTYYGISVFNGYIGIVIQSSANISLPIGELKQSKRIICYPRDSMSLGRCKLLYNQTETLDSLLLINLINSIKSDLKPSQKKNPKLKELNSTSCCVFNPILKKQLSTFDHEVGRSFLLFGPGKRAINNALQENDGKLLQNYVRSKRSSLYNFSVDCDILNKMHNSWVSVTKSVEMLMRCEPEALKEIESVFKRIISKCKEEIF